MATVRRATQNDVPQLAATLASAFIDYAWTRWIIPTQHHEVATIDWERHTGVALYDNDNDL